MQELSTVRGWTPRNPRGDDIEVTAAGAPIFRVPNYPRRSLPREPSPPAVTQIVDLSNCDDEKGPKKNKDRNQPPRPSNCFMLFRSDYVKRYSGPSHRKRVPGAHSNMTLSTRASAAWKALPESEKAHWEKKAKMEKEAHALAYPDYHYRPRKRGTVKKYQTSRQAYPEESSVPPSPEPQHVSTPTPPPPTVSVPLHRASSVPAKPRQNPPPLRAYASERNIRTEPARVEPVPRARSEEDTTPWLPIQAMQFSIPLNTATPPYSLPNNYAYTPQPAALSPASTTYESPVFSSGSSLANWNGELMSSYPPSPSQEGGAVASWFSQEHERLQQYAPSPQDCSPAGEPNLEMMWSSSTAVDCQHFATNNNNTNFQLAHQPNYSITPDMLQISHPSPLDVIPESIFDYGN